MFQEIIRELIQEGRLDFLIEKSNMDYYDLWICIKTDPTSIVNPANESNIDFNNGDEKLIQFIRENVKKVGEYTNWIIRNFNKLNSNEQYRFRIEDFAEVNENLLFFHKYKNKLPLKWNKYERNLSQSPQYYNLRDINSYGTISNPDGFYDLYLILKEFKITELPLKDPAELKKEIKTVFDNEFWGVYVPLSKESSCSLGSGTRWCTASRGDYNRFQYYSEQGELIIIFDKKNNEKYQFHLESEQFMDKDDNQIDLVSFLNENPDLSKVLNDYIEKSENYNDNEKFNFFLKSGNEFKLMNLWDKSTDKNIFHNTIIYVYLQKHKKITDEELNKFKKEDSIYFHGGKYYLRFEDWCDDNLIDLFKEGRNTDWRYGAKKILCHEMYDWFDHFDNISINDIKLNDKTEEEIRKHYNLDKNVNLLEFIEGNEELYDIINRASNDAYESGTSNEYWETVVNSLTSEFGQYEYIDNNVCFPISIYEDCDWDELVKGESLLYSVNQKKDGLTYKDLDYVSGYDMEVFYDSIIEQLGEL